MNMKEKWMKWTDNEIGPKGARTLSKTLKINTSLTSLNLQCDEKEMKNEKKRERMSESRNEQQ